MPAKDFYELTMLTTLRLDYLIFNYSLYCISIVLCYKWLRLSFSWPLLWTASILPQIDTEVQRSRFLQLSVHSEIAAGDDNAYLSHKWCDYE